MNNQNNIPNNPSINVLHASKSGLFTNYIYKAIPLAFDESMSYYETLCGLLNYLKNVIIPTVNNNANAMAELQELYVELKNYVDNYFTNLDVQQEINNKLDKMVEDGTLQEIIADYLNSKAIFGFDTVASMKSSTNLINGSFAQTLGYYNKNDGGSALYKIRTITNEDIVDNMFIIPLNNTLIAELMINDTLNVEQIGAKGDGITDDYNFISKALLVNKKIKLSFNKTYYISQPIVIDEINSLIIDGNNSTLKFNGYSDESAGNNGFIHFEDSSNIIIKNLKIDGNIEWISRPYSWESEYSNYTLLRQKTYDGFCFNNCSNITIENCKSTKVKVGFHFLETKNVNLNNSKSSYTMADGVLIHGGSEDIHVENHYVYNSNDDQFSMVHETNDNKYVKRCSYNNCSASDSFGACAVMQECVDCNIQNCSSINNKTTPIKFGTSLGTVGCTNCYMDNINVTSNNTLQGVNNSLADAQENGVIVLGSTSGSSPMINCKVSNSNFIETSGNNTNLFNSNVSGLEFYNTLFDGINLIYVDVDGNKFENCTIKSKDSNVFTRCSFTMRNTSVTNDLTYNVRGTNTIQCNGCNNVILDDVNVSGTLTEYGNCIEFYASSSDTKNVYLNTNDKKIRLVNESDVHNNGIIILTDIDRYAYGRFREGQLVYFLSNQSLYIIENNNWKKLNN